MRRFLPAVLCMASVCAAPAYCQTDGIPPLQVPAGAVVTFYSQTRLNPNAGNALDELPKGTVLKIRMLERIDSTVDPDGLEFRGVLLTPLLSGNELIVRADAEVHGLLVLLRSRNHPQGFRYELLVTSITEKGKSYELTASLRPSFEDVATLRNQRSGKETSANDKESPSHIAKSPTSKN